MRQSCMQAGCLTCYKHENGTHPNQDLSQNLGSTPKTKPTAPPDHIISVITEDFQQALLDNDMEEIQTLLRHYNLQVRTTADFLKFDHSKLTKYVKTSWKLTEPPKKTPNLLCLTTSSPSS